jgi:hypothetical protein
VLALQELPRFSADAEMIRRRPIQQYHWPEQDRFLTKQMAKDLGVAVEEYLFLIVVELEVLDRLLPFRQLLIPPRASAMASRRASTSRCRSFCIGIELVAGHNLRRNRRLVRQRVDAPRLPFYVNIAVWGASERGVP